MVSFIATERNVMSVTKKRKRVNNRAVVRAPHKTIKGVVVTLAGDYGASIQIPNGKLKNIVQQINEGRKTGKLIEISGEFVSPQHVVRVQQTQWYDYSR
jgi:hypothetical protein